MRATPRLARPSLSLPPNPPPSPHIAYCASSLDHVIGQLSLPCASRRCELASKVTPVITAPDASTGGGAGGGLPTGGSLAVAPPPPPPQPAMSSTANIDENSKYFKRAPVIAIQRDRRGAV